MTKCFFITGTDTEIGKTYVTTLLLELLSTRYDKVLGQKPLALGITDPNKQQHSDALFLQQASNLKVPYERINPYLFSSFAAPTVAFKRENRFLTAKQIADPVMKNINQLKPDFVLVEGVGGFTVPLSETESMMDVAAALTNEIILVVGLRIGCINHAILTYQAIIQFGLNCSAWVANTLDPEMPHQEETIETLRAHIPSRYLGRVPYQATISDLQWDLALLFE